MNRLTGSQALAKNQVFATLDPTTRKIFLPDGPPAVVTDTSTVAHPARKAKGIEWVLVLGQVVQAPGGEQRTDVRPGRPITATA